MLPSDQKDALGRIDVRLKLVEAALERAFRDGGAAAFAADLRFSGLVEITIDGWPLEEMGERLARQLMLELRTFRNALDRAAVELEDVEES
ncbi:hypothetical protein GCM10011415_06580 [Salipiger pallidus]|uniref:Uncharacterized protein n=1 Tax=Salipiger pallidus TaxID=1775170 RepID=A0A8J3EFB9_9RHOB|nr:hypothetical protein [Salipiger pallidus]GGG62870.1 hypothetical protein GCM10011415_06580 [Salipiger pallidus]